MKQIGLFDVLKTDEWVKPFFKQYKKSLILALTLGFITFLQLFQGSLFNEFSVIHYQQIIHFG